MPVAPCHFSVAVSSDLVCVLPLIEAGEIDEVCDSIKRKEGTCMGLLHARHFHLYDPSNPDTVQHQGPKARSVRHLQPESVSADPELFSHSCWLAAEEEAASEPQPWCGKK